MAIKKLLREGITYNSLRTIFEECCSFLDFYEAMKSYGIERKVSKVMALHFSGKGLHNQGAREYSKLHEEKLASSNSTQELTEDRPKGDHPLPHKHSECKNDPEVSTEKNVPDSKSCKAVEGGEDWESEVAMAEPRKNFTLKCTTATPLSLDVGDFSSAQSGKTKAKESPKEEPQDPSASNSSTSKVVHSSSEASEDHKVEITGKQPRGKATEAEEKGGTFRSRPNVSSHWNGKRGGRSNKPVNESKWENRTKNEAVISKKGTKRDFVKEKRPKSTDKAKERSGDKENQASADNRPVRKAGSLSKKERQFQSSSCDQSRLKDGDSSVKKQNKSQPVVTPDLHGDSAASEVAQNFTSVFIGDIAILVPVENSGQGFDSDLSALNESGSDVQDQAENATAVHCEEEGDTLPASVELSSEDAVKPDQMESCPQSESNECHSQSVHGVLETSPQDQTDNDDVTKCKEVVDTEKADSSTSEKLVDNLDLCSENASCSTAVHKGTAIFGDNSSENALHLDSNIPKGNDAVKADMEESNQDEVTLNCDVMSDTVQVPVLSVKSESVHDETVVEESNGTVIPWDELQQVSHSSLPKDASDQPTPERFVMSEGLTCHVMNTDDVCHTRHDLQAELSSESSSTSGESSMDAFSRQPPLGAERGFTPDTVLQQPDQSAWVGSVSDGFYPMPLAPGVNYPQGTLPSYGNPYGTFHQAQQALPLLKPYYPSFGYPNQMRPTVPPHMMQPYHQVCMPPYLQYRNQMMFSNTVPSVAGFPSGAVPPSQFRPQMYQVWQGPTGFTSPPVPFYGNPYQQTQETTGTILGVDSTHPNTRLSEVSPAVETANPLMDSSGLPVNSLREESGSESPSTTSSDSPFELMNGLAKRIAFHPVRDNSSLVKESSSTQMENDFNYSELHENQNETEQELKEKVEFDNMSESGNVHQVFSLTQLCIRDLPENDKVDLTELTNNSSKESIKHSEDPVHKQITILSREESAVVVGRRLSPDGSSMEGVCFDANSAQNIGRSLKESSASENTLQNSSQGNSEVKVRDVSKESPKPRRVKGSRGRRNKQTQASSGVALSREERKPSNKLSTNTIPGTSPDAVSEPTSSKNIHDSREQGDHNLEGSSDKKKTNDTQRTIRVNFTKPLVLESPHLGSRCEERSQRHTEKRAPLEDPEPVQAPKVDSRYQDRSQKHTEKRSSLKGPKQAHFRGNSRKRVFNNMARKPHTERQPPRYVSKEQGTDTRKDTNNNSGDRN